MIEDVAYEPAALQLLFRGTGWTLNVSCAWRIRASSELTVGWSDTQHDHLCKLIGMSFVSVKPQSVAFPADPTFELSDGSYLDVFADSSYEAWVFGFADMTYVGIGVL